MTLIKQSQPWLGSFAIQSGIGVVQTSIIEWSHGQAIEFTCLVSLKYDEAGKRNAKHVRRASAAAAFRTGITPTRAPHSHPDFPHFVILTASQTRLHDTARLTTILAAAVSKKSDALPDFPPRMRLGRRQQNMLLKRPSTLTNS